MRAFTPRDALCTTPDNVPLPSPTLPIGTRLDLSKVASYNRPYLLRQVCRQVIRRHRNTVDRMRRQGRLPQMQGKKMLDCHKALIRDILEFMQTADSAEVAGHAPFELQSRGSIANQCYLQGGAGFSGWSFGVHVLFRKEVDGKKLVYTHPEALMSEHSASFCVIKN